MKYLKVTLISLLINTVSTTALYSAPVTLDDVYHSINVLDHEEYDRHDALSNNQKLKTGRTHNKNKLPAASKKHLEKSKGISQ